MAAKNTQAQIEALVSSFTADLSRIMQEAVNEALRNAGTPTRKAGRKTGGTRGRARTSAAAADTALDERLYREIKKQGGRRLEELAVALNVDSKRLKLPARRLVAAKRVKKSGQARGTRYRAA